MRRTAFILLALTVFAQEREDRTLLNWDQMRAIINEASGERAMHHVLELVPYPRVRPSSEYTGNFRESEVMVRFAKEYGYTNPEIESFPAQNRSWQASEAQLWEVKPGLRKIYDVHDVAISAVSGSESGDVTAEVVDVGAGGRAEDYAGKDVKGKIVLGSAGAAILQRLGVFEREAAGVLTYSVMYAEGYSDIAVSAQISANAPQGRKPGFGWALSPRVARELSARLARGEKISLRSVIKAETWPGEMEIVHATIPGDGSSDQEVIVSAHLYEGYIKQGANDDNSGCAATLEMGRTYLRLIQEGKLPKPKRTIHFLWVPEISGTTAWLNKHTDIKRKLIADVNFDMEGLSLARAGAFWVQHRTPDTFPTFLNDVGSSMLEFVGNTNRERVRYRHNGYKFTLPVLAPNGTRDPLYYIVDKYYGASDHAVYIREGIPALMFNTWPDPWYHSSQDTPDKLDSTMFKRAVVVGTGSFVTVAIADDEMAARVAGEVLARGVGRMGDAERKGMAYLADTSDPASLRDAWRDAVATIRHQAEIEKEAVRSAKVLFKDPVEAEKRLYTLVSVVDQRSTELQNEAKAFYQLAAEQRKAPASDLALTETEKKLSLLVPERVGAAGGFGGGGGGGGGFGAAPQPSSPERTRNAAIIPQHMAPEMQVLLGRTPKLTGLELRDFLTGEFEPVSAADFLEYLNNSVKLGTMKLIERPEKRPEAPAPAKKRK